MNKILGLFGVQSKKEKRLEQSAKDALASMDAINITDKDERHSILSNLFNALGYKKNEAKSLAAKYND